MTLRTLLAFALVAWLPGALVFRLPVLDPRGRAALPAEERLLWAVVLSSGLSVMLTLALAVFGWYRFERLLLIEAGIVVALAIACRGRLRLGPDAPKPGVGALIPIAIVAGALWLYGPPAEYVLGGKDPGGYVNEGVQIAQRGALLAPDPVIASVPAEFRELVIPSHNTPSYYSSRFMGFYVIDPDAGTILGQFPHFLPASIAIGYGLDGLTGVRRVTHYWTLLGLVSVYILGARLFGRTVAATGTVLLAINVIEVWFSGYPNAEVVAQTLLFAAMLAWSRAQVDGLAFFGVVAASLLGMLLFLRVDMVIAVAGFVAAAAIGRMAGLPAVVGFFPALVVWLSAAGLYLLGLMKPYMWIPIIWLKFLPAWQLGLGAVSAIAVLIVVFAGARLPAVRRLLPWVWKVLAVAAVALVVYAYFFRVAAGRLAEHDAIALRSFTWYVMPLGLFTALVGYVAALRRFAARDSVFLLTVSLYATFVFYKIRIVPVHYWMTRRFLPIILPGAMLLAAFAAFGRWREDDRGWRYRLRAAAGVVVIGMLAVQFWRQSMPLFGHVEYAGVIPRLEKLAQTFGDRDLVIVESRDASDVHVLALPLAYIYARNVLLLPNRRPDAATMERFIAWARKQYAAVYFVGGGGTELLTRAIAVQPISTEVFQVPEWSSAWNALPDGDRRKEFDFSVYRFIDPPVAPAGGGAVALDVGVNDDVNVLRFHAKERHANGTTFRWSRDVSYINLQGVTAGDHTITLVMDDGRRPPQVPPASVEVSMNDQVLGRVTVGPDFKPYVLPIPPALAAAAGSSGTPVRVKLVTNVWRPKAVLGVPDDRDLGVMVDRVDVR
jgi:hypothetical protein